MHGLKTIRELSSLAVLGALVLAWSSDVSAANSIPLYQRGDGVPTASISPETPTASSLPEDDPDLASKPDQANPQGVRGPPESDPAAGVPQIELVKSLVVISDPVNGETNPKAIPGATVLYTIKITNKGDGPVDVDTMVFKDEVPASTRLFVGDIIGPGSGPFQFEDGSTESGLSYTFTSLGSTTDDISFSDDGGTTFSDTPVPDSDGFDHNITNIIVNLSGVFAASDGTNHPSFILTFKARVE